MTLAFWVLATIWSLMMTVLAWRNVKNSRNTRRITEFNLEVAHQNLAIAGNLKQASKAHTDLLAQTNDGIVACIRQLSGEDAATFTEGGKRRRDAAHIRLMDAETPETPEPESPLPEPDKVEHIVKPAPKKPLPGNLG
jgi:hypothetical protein